MADGWTPELRRWLEDAARAAGFDLAGVAPVAAPDSAEAAADSARFAAWLDAGHAGEMEYLKRRDADGTLLRSGVHVAMPWARSVIVCALNYNADAPRSIDPAPPGTGWIARYAWSAQADPADPASLRPNDYHDELLRRLRMLEAALQERATCTSRAYVDTGPLLERNLAALAGVGWIGKNTCVLTQTHGSWLLLAALVTSLPVEVEALTISAVDRCGSCTRCIDACPTDALLMPAAPDFIRQMDASRCIAYLTIEKKGEIPEELQPLMGRQVFGCDICQDVCPWNRRAPIATASDAMQPAAELVNPSLEWLAQLDSAGFKRHFKGSPLERTGRKRLQRNVAIAMANTGLVQAGADKANA